MPNTTIEYSANIKDIDFDSIVKTTHQLLVDICQAKLSACATRIIGINDYVVADGSDDKQALIAIKIHMLEGRTAEQKQALVQGVFDQLAEICMPKLEQQGLVCQPKIEIIDIIKNNYFFYRNY